MAMRRAFTLVELLVVVAIMGIMVTASVMSLTSGQSAARVKGAVRDVYAAIRHARSTALVTKQPSVVTYSTAMADGEVVARVEIHATKLIDTTGADEQVETVTGEPVERDVEDEAPAPKTTTAAAKTTQSAGKETATEEPTEEKGQAIEEILFAPVDDNVVKGMRLKVVMGEELAQVIVETRKPKISVFSNVDYLLGKFKEAKKTSEDASAKKDSEGADAKAGDAAKSENQEPVSVVWDTNGRVEPHQVWVYPDGKKPEDGMLIRIDRFGAVKVLSGDGREDD